MTGEIYEIFYKLFPLFTYTMYSVCLQTGCFPIRWKKAKIIQVVKPGKENVQYKYRLISLINVGGKVIEKLLIIRIMHYLYNKNLMNSNQYGFNPKQSTTDDTLTVKNT